jgi:MraZ protein
VAALLIGQYQHNIDPKGRMIMPSKFRDDLGEHFIVTKGLDGCLFVYSLAEWQVLEGKIRALPLSRSRELQRFFFSGAYEAEVDKQGRILISAPLRAYARLEKDVVVIGASTRCEIWDAAAWASQADALTPDTIAQAMNDLGF